MEYIDDPSVSKTRSVEANWGRLQSKLLVPRAKILDEAGPSDLIALKLYQYLDDLYFLIMDTTLLSFLPTSLLTKVDPGVTSNSN